MARVMPRKSLTMLPSLTVLGILALGAAGASAMSLGGPGTRIGPPTSHTSPFVNTLGGGVGVHTDRVFGPGGAGPVHPSSFSECYRRAYLRLEKLDPSMGYEFISATARHICGA